MLTRKKEFWQGAENRIHEHYVHPEELKVSNYKDNFIIIYQKNLMLLILLRSNNCLNLPINTLKQVNNQTKSI